MDPLEYLASSLTWWREYLAILAVSLALHWPFMRRLCVGVFDPLFFVLIGDAFGAAIVVFMYWRGDIAPIYFASYAFAQIFFYVGMCSAALLRPRRGLADKPQDANEVGLPLLIFGAAALLHLATTLISWGLAGIPLFRVTRLGAFAGSGGLGILERLSGPTGGIALFCALYLMCSVQGRSYRWIFFPFSTWLLFATAMSGSKSALLFIGQIVFSFAVIYGRIDARSGVFWGGRFGRGFLAIAAVFALFTLTIQRDGSVATAVASLLYRFFSYGDIYVFAYPGRMIEFVKGDNPLIGLLGAPLSTFRILPLEMIYSNIGHQLAQLVFPNLSYVAGPNPRQAVFGYHYFGHYAFVYSFVIGALTILAQRAAYYTPGRGFLGALIALQVYLALFQVGVDVETASTKLVNSFLALTVILLFALPVYFASRVTRGAASRVPVNPASAR